MNMMYGMGGIPDVKSMLKRDQSTGIGGSSIPGLGNLLGGNSVNPMSGPDMNPAGITQMTSNGLGMDPIGSLRAHGNFGTQFQRNPMAGPVNYGGG